MSSMFNFSQSIVRFFGGCQTNEGGFWGCADGFLTGLWAYIGDILVTIIFTIFKYVLNIVDLLQVLIEKLVGLDYWGTSKVSASTLSESDIIFKFLYNESVQRAFRWMVVVFVILVIVFTIIAIVKSEYETAATGDMKKSPKGPIINTMLRSFATVILVPLLLSLGILSSNAILTSIVNALNVNNDLTLGSQVFSVSSYSANRYRIFADENMRAPAANRITVSWSTARDWDEDGSVDESRDFSNQVETYLKAVNPNNYKNATFNGYYFELNEVSYLLEVDRNCDSPVFFPGYGAGTSDIPFYDINGTMGTIEEDNTRYEYKLDAYKQYLLGLGATNIKLYANVYLDNYGHGNELIEAAYHTWSFNHSYSNDSSKTLSDTIDMNTNNQFESVSGTTHTGVSYPRNTAVWGLHFDGGTGGVLDPIGTQEDAINTAFVPLRDEYYVMGDIIDFMCSENVTLNIVNSSDTRIVWDYYGGESPLNNYIRERTATFDSNFKYNDFLVSYALSGKVAYTPNPNAYSEDNGATYIMCYKTSTGRYVPLVHGVKYTNEAGKEYTFLSDYYTSGYRGVVIARGLPTATLGKNTGYPTVISNAFVNDRQGIEVTNQDEYYAKIETVYPANTDKYYSTFYKVKDFDAEINESWFDEKDGAYYLKTYNPMIADVNVDAETWVYGALLSAENAKNRIEYSLPKKFVVNNDAGGSSTITSTWTFDKPLYDNTKGTKFAVFASSVATYYAIVDMNSVLNNKFDFYIATSADDGATFEYIPIVTKAPEVPATHIMMDSSFVLNNSTYEYLKEGLAVEDIKAIVDGSFVSVSTLIEDGVTAFGARFTIPRVFRDFNAKLNDNTNSPTGKDARPGILKYCTTAHYDSDPDINLEEGFTKADTYDDDNNKTGFVVTFVSDNSTNPTLLDGVTETQVPFRLYFDNNNKLLRVEATDYFALVMFGITSGGALNGNDIRTSNIAFTTDDMTYVKSDGENRVYSYMFDNQAYYSNMKINSSNVKSAVDFETYVWKRIYSWDLNRHVLDSENKLMPDPNYLEDTTEPYSYSNYKTAVKMIIQDNIYAWLAELAGATGVAFYDSMMPIKVSYDSAFRFDVKDGGTYSYDPENQVYYDNGEIYIFVTNVFTGISTFTNLTDGTDTPEEKALKGTVFYSKCKADDGSLDATKTNELKTTITNKFTSRTEEFLISADQVSLKSGNIKYMGEVYEIPAGHGTSVTYDEYSVEFLLFNGKVKNIEDISADAYYLGRVYSTIRLKRDNADVKQEFDIGTHIDNNTLSNLINGSYSYIIGGIDFDRVPTYDTTNVNISQIYEGFGTQIFFKYYESFHNLVILDISIFDIFSGGSAWRWNIGSSVYDKPAAKQVLSLANGQININYNMPAFNIGTNNQLTFANVYVPHKFNFIVFVFATIVIFGIIFTSVWGLITRIYEITMYFIIMPGVAAVTPLDGGKMFGNWKTNIVKKVLGAYGVMIGLNLFFLLIPPIKSASQIFSASDFDRLYLNWIPGEFKAKYINLIIYLMFLLVALSMLKTLPALIANMLNAENVYEKGVATKKAVKDTIKEVGDTVSGKKMVAGFQEAFGKLEKGKDGKYHRNGGFLNPKTFIPGKAVYDAYVARRDMKDAERQEAIKNRQEQIKAFQTAKANEEQDALKEKLAAGYKAGVQAGAGGTDADTNKQNDLNTTQQNQVENIATDTVEQTVDNAVTDAIENNEAMQERDMIVDIEASRLANEDLQNLNYMLGNTPLSRKGKNDMGYQKFALLDGDENWENLQKDVADKLIEGKDVLETEDILERSLVANKEAAEQAEAKRAQAEFDGNAEAAAAAEAERDKYLQNAKEVDERLTGLRVAVKERDEYASLKIFGATGSGKNNYRNLVSEDAIAASADKIAAGLEKDGKADEAATVRAVADDARNRKAAVEAAMEAERIKNITPEERQMEINSDRLAQIDNEMDKIRMLPNFEDKDVQDKYYKLGMERDNIRQAQKELQQEDARFKTYAAGEDTQEDKDRAVKMESNNSRLASIDKELDDIDKASYTDERAREEDRAVLLMERDNIRAEQKKLQSEEDKHIKDKQAAMQYKADVDAKVAAAGAAAAAKFNKTTSTGTGTSTASTTGTGSDDASAKAAKDAAEEAKFYADIAKGFADISQKRSDIEAGNLPDMTDEELGIGGGKKTRAQRKLDKAENKQQSDQERLESGKGIRLSNKHKEDAYEEQNKRVLESNDKAALTKLVINETTKNSKTMQEIMKKHGCKTIDQLKTKMQGELLRERMQAEYAKLDPNSPEAQTFKDHMAVSLKALSKTGKLTGEEKRALENAEKLYNANQKANTKTSESEYAIKLHAEKVGKLQTKVARQKERREEKVEKQRIKQEAWDSKSGLGKFVTRAGQTIGVLSGVGIPIMLAIKAGKGIKNVAARHTADKYVEAKDNHTKAVENANAVKAILNDNTKYSTMQSKLNEIKKIKPELYAQIKKEFDNDKNTLGWDKANNSIKIKTIDKYITDAENKAKADLDKYEKKVEIRSQAKASGKIIKFVKPMERVENREKAKAQKEANEKARREKIRTSGTEKQKKRLDRREKFESAVDGLREKVAERRIRFAKYSRQKTENKRATQEALKKLGASGVVQKTYENSRIKHRENFINEKLRREDIASVVKSMKLGDVQSSYKTRVSGVMQGLNTVNNADIKKAIKDAGLDRSDIHTMSMTEIKKAVDKLKENTKSTMNNLATKIEEGAATDMEKATYKTLQKTFKDLESKNEKLVTKAMRKRVGATADEAKGNTPVTPTSTRDRVARGQATAVHYSLTDEDLRKVAAASKKYMKTMNGLETKYGASKTKNANDAYANTKNIEKIIENKIQTATNAKDIEQLRQDLVKMRLAYKEMSKDIKKINTELSPVSAAVHAQNMYRNTTQTTSSATSAKPTTKPKS